MGAAAAATAFAAMMGPEVRFAPKKPDIKADLDAQKTFLARAKTSGRKADEGKAYSTIATLYIKAKKYEKALESAEEALAIFTEIGDKDLKMCEYQKVYNLKKMVDDMKGPKFEMLVAAKKGLDAGDDYAVFDAAAQLYSTRLAS